jgi:hypothetical protein
MHPEGSLMKYFCKSFWILYCTLSTPFKLKWCEVCHNHPQNECSTYTLARQTKFLVTLT